MLSHVAQEAIHCEMSTTVVSHSSVGNTHDDIKTKKGNNYIMIKWKTLFGIFL